MLIRVLELDKWHSSESELSKLAGFKTFLLGILIP